MNTKKTAEDRAAEKYPNSIKYGLFDSVSNIQFRKVYATCIREEVEPRQAEIERLRALVQELVESEADLLNRMNDLCAFIAAKGSSQMLDTLVDSFSPATLNRAALKALSTAKQEGFVPTNTTEA